MKNKFFHWALRRAVGLISKRSELLLLLTQLSTKLSTVNWKSIKVVAVKEKFFTFARLIKAYTLGYYREISWRSMIAIVASIVYFVSPVDLIPDFIPLTGLSDDIGILAWVFNAVSKEVDRFVTWEKSVIRS